MLHRVWTLLRDTVEGFVNDGAMSRGAAIAYYTIFLLHRSAAGRRFGAVVGSARRGRNLAPQRKFDAAERPMPAGRPAKLAKIEIRVRVSRALTATMRLFRPCPWLKAGKFCCRLDAAA